MNETNALAPAPKKEQRILSPDATVGFNDQDSFTYTQRVATMLCKSKLVPEHFRGEDNMPNCVIALNMAKRMNADIMAVMQSIYMVHGKPSWSSQFIIACVNTCGRFSPLKFELTGAGDDRQCVAWATEKGSNERLDSPPVTIKMAKAEGWFSKIGSKWQTMPEVMLRYRSATFFGRMYAPEMLMGMRSEEEIIDIDATVSNSLPPVAKAVQIVDVRQLAEANPVIATDPVTTVPASDPAFGAAQEATVLEKSPQEKLQDLVTGCGSSFDKLRAVLLEAGGAWPKISDECDGFEQMPIGITTKLLKADRTLKSMLTAKGVAA